MKVNNIKMKRFGIIDDADITLADGINVFSGKIGQGKSTVTKALALGTIDYTEKKISDLVQWGEKDFEFEFDFSHDTDYKIAVKAGKTTNRELQFGGNVYNNSEAVKKLAEKFDPSLTKAAMVSLQNEGNDLVTCTNSVRRETFKKIYDLNFGKEVKQLEEIRKQIEEELEPIKKQITILANKQYTEQELLIYPFTEEEYKQLKLKLETLFAKKSQIEAQLEMKQQKADALIEAKRQRDSVISDIQSKDAVITTKNGKIDTVNKQISDLDEKVDTEQEKTATDIASKQQEKERLEKQKSEITLERLARWSDTELTDAQNELSSLKTHKGIIEKNITVCETGECATCGQAVDASHTQKLKDELAEIEAKIPDVEQKVADLKTAKKAHEEKVDANQKAKEQKTKLENDISAIDTFLATANENLSVRLQSIEEQKKAKQEQIEELQTEITTLESEKATLESTKADKLAAVDKAQKALSDFGDVATTDEIDAEITPIETKISDYDSITSRNQLITEQNEKLKKEKETDAVTLAEHRTQENEKEGQIQDLKYGETILKKDFPNWILTGLIQQVQDYMNEFLNATYGGRYEVFLEEQKDGIAFLYGKNKADVSSASGGETDLFNIGFKLAFSKIAKMGALWLDEVDKYMDSAQAGLVFGYLYEQYTAGNIEQLIIISHNDEVKQILETEFQARVFDVQEGKIEQVA